MGPFLLAVAVYASDLNWIAARFIVPQDADPETIKAKHEEMQKALERVRDIAEGWFAFKEEERNRYRAEIGRSFVNKRPSPVTLVPSCSPSFTGISSFFAPR